MPPLSFAALQRDEQVAEWIRLVDGEEEVSSQPVTKPQGGRLESGVRRAARELGVNRMDAHRATKVDSIDPEAKKAAAAYRHFGLNTSPADVLS